MERLCCLLNLPKPIACKNYDNISDHYGVAAKFIAEKGMIEAAKEGKEMEGSSNITVSVDGTSQKRGFVSLNGAVIAIVVQNEKVIDAEQLSGFCKACVVQEELRKVDEKE